MNKSWFYLGAIGSLAMLITSCGGDGGKPATPATSPSAVASPTAAPAATVPTATPATLATAPKPAGAAKAPTVPATATAKKPVSVDVAAGLIPPTDGDSWAKTVAKGRPDPFASLALQPIEVAEKEPLDGTGKPQKPSTKIASNPNLPAVKSGVNKPLPTIKVATNPIPITTVLGKQKTASKGGNSTATKKIGNSPIAAVPISGVKKALPKIKVSIPSTKPSKAPTATKIAKNNVLRPVSIGATTSKTPGVTTIATKADPVAAKPLQAMAMDVTGVIEVAGRTQVIVKLPSESFSRYIDVGERIANGKVLVKRVEGQQSLSPTVVLEEVGVEVPRKIGDKSAATAPESQPAAATTSASDPAAKPQ
jgi:hypothetical protein